MDEPKHSGLKFRHNGVIYSIEFRREYKQVLLGGERKMDRPFTGPSKYPYTTVMLVEQKPGCLPMVYRTGTVGYWFKDRVRFSLERGRINALRLISKTLDKDLKKAIWSCYKSR